MDFAEWAPCTGEMMAEWDVVSSEPLTAAKPIVKASTSGGEWSVISHEPIAVEGGPVPSTGAPKGFYAVTGDDGKQTLRRELGVGDFIKSLSDLPGVGAAERMGQGAVRLAGKAASGIAGLFGADPTKIQGAVNSTTELPPSNDPLVKGMELAGQGAQAVAAPIDRAVGNLSPGLRTGIEATEEALPDIAGVLGMRGLAGVTGAARAGGATEEAGGFRNADAHPIARDIAGGSGKDALTFHNQVVGNAVAGSEAGIAPGVQLGYPNVIAARAAPNSVYDRVAAAVPDGPLSDTAQNSILRAGQPEGGRVSQGSPVAQQQIETLRSQLLSQTNREGGQWTGQNWVNELRGLRQEGFSNVASKDVSNQQLGRAQLDMARAIESHIGDSIPANSNVSLEQFQQARQQLAKNFAVQAALRGSHIDMGAIARVQRADPELLTGGLQHMADFANDNSDVTGLASRIYSPPSYTQDLMGVPGTHKLENFLSPSFWTGAAGGQALARRILTGSTPDAVRAMQGRFPGTSAEQFGPLEPQPPQPPPGMTAPPPTAPPAAPAAPLGDISLADFLSHGVEQSAAPELTTGPMGVPAQSGLPFHVEPSHMAGELSLMDELAPTAPANHRDMAGIMSQEVPEDIASRAQSSGVQVAHEADELGNHTFTTPNGELTARENGPYLQVQRSDVAAAARGRGEGMAMMERAAHAAGERGLQLASDVSVSPAAQQLYAGMKRRGFSITKNPSAVNPDTGNLVSKDPRKPVFVVSPRSLPLAQALEGAGG